MTAWNECTRFDVFNDCDVYVESPGHYIYVEDRPYNYHGDYTARVYQQGTNLDGTKFYMQCEYVPASNDYIIGLKPAPWNIARDIVAKELEIWAQHEKVSDEENAECILAARGALLEDSVEGEKFVWL